MTYPGTKVRKFLNIPNEKYRVTFIDWSPVLFFYFGVSLDSVLLGKIPEREWQQCIYRWEYLNFT